MGETGGDFPGKQACTTLLEVVVGVALAISLTDYIKDFDSTNWKSVLYPRGVLLVVFLSFATRFFLGQQTTFARKSECSTKQNFVDIICFLAQALVFVAMSQAYKYEAALVVLLLALIFVDTVWLVISKHWFKQTIPPYANWMKHNVAMFVYLPVHLIASCPVWVLLAVSIFAWIWDLHKNKYFYFGK